MIPSRRRFLRQVSAFGLACASKRALANSMQIQGGMKMPPVAPPPALMLHSLELTPFVDALPLPARAEFANTSPRTLKIKMREIAVQVHRDLKPTRMWSYGETALAPLIEARSHQPLAIEWVNALPAKHFLPIDHSLHGCGREHPDVRAVVHVHGARVHSKDDGHPEDWFVSGQSATCTYPLEQDATALWYHDHAMGLNRLNVYAGLFGMFLIRDAVEDALDLPRGIYELPLMLYDRDFTADGQLYYPTSGDHEHPWVPEFAGDAILINGKIRPFFEVEPRLYRLRMVNVSNSRFFRLSFSAVDGSSARPKPVAFHQIGADQGLLAQPVQLSVVSLAPAERGDVLVDFSSFTGQKVHLRNGALDIIEFRVAATHSLRRGGGMASLQTLPKTLRTINRLPESTAVKTRTITLNEYQDKIGKPMVMLLNRMHWHEPVTETPRLHSTEIWEFVNLTEDTHPMHLHLVRFQILDRRVFDVFNYTMYKNLRFTAPAVPPDAGEAGWKDVVQCPAGMITRVLIKFDGYAGDYLYHCHILEHEANDMMRPFQVVA